MNDYCKVYSLLQTYDWFAGIYSEARKEALARMCLSFMDVQEPRLARYDFGLSRMLREQSLIRALGQGQWDRAADIIEEIDFPPFYMRVADTIRTGELLSEAA